MEDLQDSVSHIQTIVAEEAKLATSSHTILLKLIKRNATDLITRLASPPGEGAFGGRISFRSHIEETITAGTQSQLQGLANHLVPRIVLAPFRAENFTYIDSSGALLELALSDTVNSWTLLSPCKYVPMKDAQA